MKKLFSKIKSINKQIEEAETEVKNIKAAPSTFYKTGEKQHDLSKLNHWIGELNESKVKLLLQLVDSANSEIENLTSHAAAS